MYRYTYDQNLLLRPSEGLTNYRQGEQRAADRGVRAAEITKQLLTKYECTPVCRGAACACKRTAAA